MTLDKQKSKYSSIATTGKTFADKLVGEKVYLAKAKMSDLDDIYNNFYSREETAKYMLWTVDKSLDETRARLTKMIEYQKTHFAYLVYEKSSGRAIGTAGFNEIENGVYEDSGIGIGEDYVGRGYGKETLKLLVNYMFEALGASKIIYGTLADNIPSKRLAMSVGFSLERSEKALREKDNKEYTYEYYSLKKEK